MVCEGRVLNPPCRVTIHRPESDFRMEKDITTKVLEIKLLAHIRDENHRKFQAFALVHAHDPYYVFSFS